MRTGLSAKTIIIRLTFEKTAICPSQNLAFLNVQSLRWEEGEMRWSLVSSTTLLIFLPETFFFLLAQEFAEQKNLFAESIRIGD